MVVITTPPSPAGGDLSPVLQEAELDLISNAECRNSFQQTTLTITDNMMCAYTEGRDACQVIEDSGYSTLSIHYYCHLYCYYFTCT